MGLIQKYNGNPDWNIGGLFSHDDFWIPFLNELKNKKVELPFQYIYGTPRNIFAGGGRDIVAEAHTDNFKNSPEMIMEVYKNLGIKCRLALSNHLLQEKYFYDELLNHYLAYLNNDFPGSGVIICDDKFNNYIKENYPNIQRICSVIRPAIEVGWGNENEDFYNDLCEKYDMVVLNCGFAKDIEKINRLKYKDKVEVLVNTRCTLNCKLAKSHYDNVAEKYLLKINNNKTEEEIIKAEEEIFLACDKIKSKNPFSGANFSREEIQNLLDNGVFHFKLEGRHWPVQMVIRDMGYYICDEVLLVRLCRNIMGAEM